MIVLVFHYPSMSRAVPQHSHILNTSKRASRRIINQRDFSVLPIRRYPSITFGQRESNPCDSFRIRSNSDLHCPKTLFEISTARAVNISCLKSSTPIMGRCPKLIMWRKISKGVVVNYKKITKYPLPALPHKYNDYIPQH